MMRIRRSEQSFRIIAEILESGGVAVMACDTIYGFVGKVPESENTIRDIKGREETKPFLQLIADSRQLAGLGFEIPPKEFSGLWPGPFTYVLKGFGDNTVAFRVPEDENLRALISLVGTPLYSTSVNRAGHPPMDNPDTIEAEFGNELPLIEDAGLFSGQPSTVVNLSERPFRILRQGAGIVPPDFLL